MFNPINIIVLCSVPFLTTMLVHFFDYSINHATKLSYEPYPIAKEVRKLPKCVSPDDCVSLGYMILGENQPWIHDVMKKVSQKNDLEFGTDVLNLITTKN